ncbi:MAG: D-lyxose/D-mannose family sugar isomerase [Ruminococcaceae bacterium]|nr:D-lyxose/D-mannose family sugar isomerase [Oscillospiraceae bacterium]
MKRKDIESRTLTALEFYEKAAIVLSEKEKGNIEVCDFGLDNVEEIGLQILTYINTERVCAKEMVLTPGQTCPEHMHVATDGKEGKEETFRCRYGKVYLYVSGNGKKEDIKAKVPPTDISVFTEVILNPGQQYTIMPETLHWFQAGEDGAVVSEFSTKSTDETDVFTDKRIVRETKIED